MFHHAKTTTTTTFKRVNLKPLPDESEYKWMSFELTDDNNRSKSAAKNDILRATANYITTENTFTL